jgi:hypothetical protein
LSIGGYNRIDSRQPNLSGLRRRGEGQQCESRQDKELCPSVHLTRAPSTAGGWTTALDNIGAKAETQSTQYF